MTASVTADIRAGLAARHEGQAAVVAADVAVHKDFGTYVRQALDYWTRIRAGETFTSDDVRLMADYYARRDGRTFDGAPNLLPAFMGAAARNGRIVEVGRTPSTRPSRRASKVTVYRSAS